MVTIRNLLENIEKVVSSDSNSFEMVSDKNIQDIDPSDMVKINGTTWKVDSVSRVEDSVILGLCRKIRGKPVSWSIQAEITKD